MGTIAHWLADKTGLQFLDSAVAVWIVLAGLVISAVLATYLYLKYNGSYRG